MGRPPTKARELRDGWYIEVRNKGSKSTGIHIWRGSEEDMNMAADNYRKSKDVIVKGESKGGKWVNEIEAKKKKKKKK